jgi:hypothetical protein
MLLSEGSGKTIRGGECEPIKIIWENLVYISKLTRRPSLLIQPKLHIYRKTIDTRNQVRNRRNTTKNSNWCESRHVQDYVNQNKPTSNSKFLRIFYQTSVIRDKVTSSEAWLELEKLNIWTGDSIKYRQYEKRQEQSTNHCPRNGTFGAASAKSRRAEAARGNETYSREHRGGQLLPQLRTQGHKKIQLCTQRADNRSSEWRTKSPNSTSRLLRTTQAHEPRPRNHYPPQAPTGTGIKKNKPDLENQESGARLAGQSEWFWPDQAWEILNQTLIIKGQNFKRQNLE